MIIYVNNSIQIVHDENFEPPNHYVPIENKSVKIFLIYHSSMAWLLPTSKWINKLWRGRGEINQIKSLSFVQP